MEHKDDRQNERSKMQKIETDMLKAVTDLCDRYGLSYSLYCGTLLGAVRHEGFIPWDEDVDITMPLKDYRKFLKLSDKLPAPYVLQYPGSTKGYYLTWARVYADGTTCMDRRLAGKGNAEYDMHQGFHMDIYPMIGAAKSEAGQKAQRVFLRAALGMRSPEFHRLLGDMKPKHKMVGVMPYAVRDIISKICLKSVMLDPDKCELIGTIDSAPFMGKYQYDDWKALKRAAFGEWEFAIPRRYDKLLTRIYGNYMKLPPEEQRVAISDELEMIIDADRDYREYQEEER